MPESSRERAGSPRAARYLRIALFVLLVAALNLAGAWLAQRIDFQLFPRHEPLLHSIVLGSVVLYIALMAIPFMPGIEVGLALMLILGAKGAVLVYLSTLVALSLSFAAGRVVPARALWRLLEWLHLFRASRLVRRLEPLEPRQRLALLDAQAPARIAPFVLRHRYLAIAAALNLPGNSLIGGGGGIALVVGMSRIVPFHAYLALIAVATAPVPAWFFLQGR